MVDRIFPKADLNRLIQDYKKKLEAMDIPVDRMVLYGSYAKNSPRPGSDVDLCVISSAFKDCIEATMMLYKLRSDDELVMSPIAFSPDTFVDENPLAWEIKRTGVSV